MAQRIKAVEWPLRWVDSGAAFVIIMGGARGIFGRHTLSRLKSYIKVDWGRSCMFLLTSTVWRILSRQDKSWKCPRAQVQITKNLPVSRFCPFVHAVIPFSRHLFTEHIWCYSCDKKEKQREGRGVWRWWLCLKDGCMLVSWTLDFRHMVKHETHAYWAVLRVEECYRQMQQKNTEWF